MFNALVKGSLILAIVGTIALVGAFMYAYEEIALDADKLIHYTPETSSVILDRNGEKLAYIFKKQHRLYARYDEIPGFLVEGLVAMEDTRFFEHNGVNPDAILRAIVKDIKAGHFVEGGSTITQQLIKNKVLSNEKKLARKIKEAILALKIEHELSKEDILERYLNEISYGNNYFGVKTAANGYFHKEMKNLTQKEMAILVGLPNAPSFYNPIRHYKRALDRANNVLYRMKSIGWISQVDYLKAVKESPRVYKTSLTQNIAPYIVDEVLRRFRGRLDDIRTGGYQIYTTIDMKQQSIARAVVRENYQRLLKKYHENPKKTKLNAAFVSVESSTGDILTLVGGNSYKHSAFNRVTQSRRQPGSAFKPFIYQTALDMGYNPATPLTDLARTFEYYANGKRKVWRPKNAEHNFKGFIPLREALVHSRNLATINLVDELGLKTIRERLAFLDIPHIPKDMSIALGNLGLSPLKMAQIYSVFANRGHMIEPRLVSKIVSKEGAIIYETCPKEIVDFTTAEQAYLTTNILQDVINRGTGSKAAVKEVELAGKTGTTNNYVDAWFCGYSPTIEAISWIGRDDNKPIGKYASGGNAAAPVFAAYFDAVYKLYPQLKRTFDIPKGVSKGIYHGKTELYTKISPLPGEKKLKNSYTQILNDEDEIISIEKETEFMETLDIEDDDYSSKKGDALHPARKVPLRPVSEDSGELF